MNKLTLSKQQDFIKALRRVVREELKDFVTIGYVDNKFNQVLNGQDKILKKLEILEQEKIARGNQILRERKWRAVITDALIRKRVLTPKEIEYLKELDVLPI